jgi:tetratricopeptide (TPR) repeat protein
MAVWQKFLDEHWSVRYWRRSSMQTPAHISGPNAFNKPRADLFDMQDEITTRLARRVGIELVAAEGQRAERERPDNMDAVDLAMRGRAIMNRPFSVENAHEARALFEAALRLDRNHVGAPVGLAESHVFEVRTFASTDRVEQLRAAETAIDKALVLAPSNANAHFVHAVLLHLMRAPERALEECELAIVLDRNMPNAHANAGFMKLMVGRGEETEGDIGERSDSIRAIRPEQLVHFDGRREPVPRPVRARGGASAPLRRHEPAPSHGSLFPGVCIGPRRPDGRGGAGRDAGLKLDPNFSVAKFRDDQRSDPVYLHQRERVYDGLRKAGVPEGQ